MRLKFPRVCDIFHFSVFDTHRYKSNGSSPRSQPHPVLPLAAAKRAATGTSWARGQSENHGDHGLIEAIYGPLLTMYLYLFMILVRLMSQQTSILQFNICSTSCKKPHFPRNMHFTGRRGWRNASSPNRRACKCGPTAVITYTLYIILYMYSVIYCI